MNNKESELRVADLFAMLLKAAVPIVCTMLVLGLLCGAYGLYKAKTRKPSVSKEDLAAAETAATTAKNDVRKAERARNKQVEVEIPDAERKVKNNEEQTQRRQMYLDNSLLQSLDAFHCGISRITFYIKTDFTVEPEVAGLVEDPRETVAMAYARGYLNDEALIEQLRKVMGTDAETQYVIEMAKVSNTSGRFVEIVAYHEDPQVAERMAKTIFETLNKRINDTVAPHEANIIQTFTGYEVNWDLYNQQIANEDKYILASRAQEEAKSNYLTLVETVEEKEEAVEDATFAYEDAVENLNALKKQYENTVPSKRNMLKNTALFGVIGAAAGLVLACVLVWIVSLLNGKLHNQSEVKSRYAFPLIGVLPREKKLLFEKAVRKLEGEAAGSFEAKGQATAQSLAAQIGDKRVCLISTLGAEAANKLAAFTDGKTPVCGNILNDAEAVKALDAYQGAVLVERRGKSRIDLIDAEVLRAKALNKEIVGIVLL